MRTSLPSRRALLILTAWCLAIGGSASVGLASWPQALIETGLILGVFALVFGQPSFRAVMSAAPRTLRLGATGLVVLWGWSQIRGVQFATYPFMSWRMYGESLGTTPVVGYRLLGEECAGRLRVIPETGGALGARPILATGIRRAYNQSLSAPALAPVALTRTDSLLHQMITRLNTDRRRPALCRLHLQRLEVPVHTLKTGTIPPYVTVRRYVLR